MYTISEVHWAFGEQFLSGAKSQLYCFLPVVVHLETFLNGDKWRKYVIIFMLFLFVSY